MREWMSEHQDWERPEHESDPRGWLSRMSRLFPRALVEGRFAPVPYSDRCGPVRAGGTVRPAYTSREAEDVIRAGQTDPRRLGLEEAQTASRNRAAYARELRPFGRESRGANRMTGVSE